MTDLAGSPYPPPSGAPLRAPSFGMRHPRLVAAAAVAVAIGLVVAGYSAAVAIAAVFVVGVPLEKLWPRHRQRVRRPELSTDLLWAMLAPLSQIIGAVVAIVIGLVSLAWVPALPLRPLVLAMPGPVRAITGFLLFDFLVYLSHRASHELPFLWRFHSVHHSTRTLDWVSGFRTHPLDGVFAAPAFAVLLGAGFSLRIAGALAVVQVILGISAHLNVRWELRPLQRFVFTPEFHHWHHSNEREAWNKNYGVFLPIWDILFSTCYLPGDRRPESYGIDQPMPSGVLAQLMQPFRRNLPIAPSVGQIG